jgi:hypothetical protein
MTIPAEALPDRDLPSSRTVRHEDRSYHSAYPPQFRP